MKIARYIILFVAVCMTLTAAQTVAHYNAERKASLSSSAEVLTLRVGSSESARAELLGASI